MPGRIAGAFWDLDEHDETVEEHDAFNATFADIWEVFDVRRPETMAEWWAGWKALGKDSCGASGSLFQNSIDYNLAPNVAPIPDVVIDEDEGTSHVYVQLRDSQGREQLTDGTVRDRYPTWSPDGTELIFTRQIPGEGSCSLMITGARRFSRC